MDKNIAFLIGVELDENGRSVQQYLHFEDHEWEFQHDVIQMAFPTKTQSRFHPNQPFLPATFDISGLTDDQRQRCKATISLLLHGYLKSLNVEFLINHDKITLISKFDHPDWAATVDHNTLRLTRILECLGIFDMHNIQRALCDFLVYDIAIKNCSRINAKTVAFWVAARENKLHLLR